MSLRRHLMAILVRDPRYPAAAYQFAMDALAGLEDRRRRARRRARAAARDRRTAGEPPFDPGGDSPHVTPREFCEAFVELARDRYGPLARTVLAEWNVRDAADLGAIVANLTAAGDLRLAEGESPDDFRTALDLAAALDSEPPRS